MSPHADIAAMSAYGDTAALSSYPDTMTAFTNTRSLPKLGSTVRGLRLRRGLTQAELAERAGVSRQWIVSLEQGRTRGMEIGLVLRVLDSLDASLYVRDDLEER